MVAEHGDGVAVLESGPAQGAQVVRSAYLPEAARGGLGANAGWSGQRRRGRKTERAQRREKPSPAGYTILHGHLASLSSPSPALGRSVRAPVWRGGLFLFIQEPCRRPSVYLAPYTQRSVIVAYGGTTLDGERRGTLSPLSAQAGPDAVKRAWPRGFHLPGNRPCGTRGTVPPSFIFNGLEPRNSRLFRCGCSNCFS